MTIGGWGSRVRRNALLAPDDVCCRGAPCAARKRISEVEVTSAADAASASGGDRMVSGVGRFILGGFAGRTS